MNIPHSSRLLGFQALMLAALGPTLALAEGPPATQGHAHWGYEETVGPEHWGELPGDSLCATGHQQTPIALETVSSVRQDVEAPTFSYGVSKLNMVNNGHTVQFDQDAGGSSLTIGKTHYSLAQLHFHTPSEHTVDGIRYPMEMHLVHTDASGKPAVVVAVFIKAGTGPNRALESAFRHLPSQQGEHIQPPLDTFHPGELLPADRTFFHYLGSLTTPPCTEGIQWYVMEHPIELAPEQIEAFQAIAHLNPSNRPLQSRNQRTVTLTSPHAVSAHTP